MRKIRERYLAEPEVLEILREAGIPFARTVICSTVDEAAAAARSLRYPVALKLVSPDIAERSKVGGVRAGVGSEPELRRIFEDLVRKAETAGWRVAGVVVQEYIPAGREVRVRGFRDEKLGPAVMFEPVGFWAEVLGDCNFRLAPLDRREAEEMVRETFAYHLLGGADGSRPSDIGALVDAICRVGDLISRAGHISEISLHPLKLLEKGAVAVDVKVKVRVG